MMIRKLAAAMALALATSMIGGCGAGTTIEEGIEDNVDMTKDYSPPVSTSMFTPQDQRKAAEKGKEEMAKPVTDPGPAPTP